MKFTNVEKQSYLNSIKRSFKKHREVNVTMEGTNLYKPELADVLTEILSHNNYIMKLVNDEITEIIKYSMSGTVARFIDSNIDGGYEKFHSIMTSSDTKSKNKILDTLRDTISENEEIIFSTIEDEIIDTADTLLNHLVEINNENDVVDSKPNILN